MLPNLSVLVKKCEQAGLKVAIKGKKATKADYVRALRDNALKTLYPSGMPYEELSLALCFPYWNLKESEQKSVWTDPRFVVQSKENGCRAALHFVAGKGVFAHSRTVSVKTWGYQELHQQFIWRDFIPDFTATVDCETIIEKSVDTRPYTTKGEVTKTSLHSTIAVLHLEAEASRRLQVEQDAPLIFKVLDITKWEGRDVKNQPYRQRLELITAFFAKVNTLEIGKYFIQLPVFRQNKKAFFESVVAAGGEGVVLKNLNEAYEDSSSRSRNNWIKVKKRKELDAFVTGFKRGEPDGGWVDLIGALEFSVNLEGGGTHVIGYATNLSYETRVAMTVFSGGEVSLKPEVYGRVAQISGQDISARELRLSHCTLDRWRDGAGDEKSADDCVVSMQDLKDSAEWVG